METSRLLTTPPCDSALAWPCVAATSQSCQFENSRRRRALQSWKHEHATTKAQWLHENIKLKKTLERIGQFLNVNWSDRGADCGGKCVDTNGCFEEKLGQRYMKDTLLVAVEECVKGDRLGGGHWTVMEALMTYIVQPPGRL